MTSAGEAGRMPAELGQEKQTALSQEQRGDCTGGFGPHFYPLGGAAGKVGSQKTALRIYNLVDGAVLLLGVVY